MEKAMTPHSSTLAWKIPWTEEPGRLQSMGLLRVGHDWATSLSLSTFRHWRRKWQPTALFLPGESQGRGAWWAAVYGVAQSRTQLKRLSSSRSTVVLCLVLWETSIWFLAVAVPVYIPTNSIQAFSFCHILSNICYLCSFWWWPFWQPRGDTPCGSWFAFPWWWAMLPIFSYACWASVCPLDRSWLEQRPWSYVQAFFCVLITFSHMSPS